MHASSSVAYVIREDVLRRMNLSKRMYTIGNAGNDKAYGIKIHETANLYKF